ncbi:MAG: radical SAM protein [Synergistaceae bacterium]|jgi:histone acetyltransferase (RNA polymerase elongator complex component)|nr:radical SAM protein [Synergistaceae bacterium]
MKRLAFFIPFQGCTRRCVYCDQTAISGVIVPPSPEAVESRVALSAPDNPIELCFFGGSFARLDLSLMESYLHAVYSAQDGSLVTFSSYPGDFSGLRGSRLIELLKRHPIGTIELGVPSLDLSVLAACGRGDDPEETKKSIMSLARAGFHLGMQTMIGLPGQSFASALEDIGTLAGLIASSGASGWDLRIYPCLVLRGTELEAMYERGEYRPLSIEEAVRQAGALLLAAERSGLNAIRVGLLDSDSLRDAVLAGPYHPSFGELALSEKLALKLAENFGPLVIDKRHISRLTGHGRRGLRRLSQLTKLSEEILWERIIYR